MKRKTGQIPGKIRLALPDEASRFFRFKEEEDGLVFSKNLYIWSIHGHYITECKNAILMKNNKKRPLEKYLAPTAEVVQVDVERGFAVSAPGYGDGGIW